jgi:hypothetical protein
MNTLHESKLLIKCPHCGGNFSPEDAISHDLRIQLERDFERKLSERSRVMEQQIRKQENERYLHQLEVLKQDAQSKAKRLKMLEEETMNLRQKEMEIKDREENIEIEMKKRFLERERVIREQADKTALEKALLQVREREQKLDRDRETLELMLKKRVQDETEKAREEERMKNMELQKKLDDQNKLINEMKRKSEQGSMQLQGEVQELALEEHLRNSFPLDEVQEIAKGKRGGDCVHIVKDHYGHICGKILYESKRTKHFSHEWITKLKEDMRLKQADLGVIVTEVLPDGMCRFGEIDGVWICTFPEFKALSLLFRFNLSRIGEVLSSQENRGEKMHMIYRYVTGVEFRQKLEASFEAFNEMQDDLQKEKALLIAQWARREKRLLKAMENLVCLYGDVRGIAGGAVQEIRSLEMREALSLEE